MTKRLVTLLVLLIALFVSSSHLASAAAPADSFASVFSGTAYGDYASIVAGKNETTAGPTAPASVGCTTATTPVTNSASLALGSIGGSGTDQSTITPSRTATSSSITATSDVQNLNLLNGSLTFARIHVSVTSTATSAGATSTNNSTFTGLNIAGTPQTDPAPNTRRNLPGVGYVILNEQSGPVNGPDATSSSVYGVDVHITLGPFAGSQILIGFASSAETRTAAPDLVNAGAYGLYANGIASSGASTLGPLSPSYINCTGGSAQNSASGFNSALVGNGGSISSSASGQITSSGASASGQATLSGVNLLGGLISASHVTSTARAHWQGSGSNSGSTTLTNSQVAGDTLSNSPAPNTRINLPGVGYVIVNEQYGSSNASGANELVIAFDIYVTQSNLLGPGIPQGARIVVGAAYVSAVSY